LFGPEVTTLAQQLALHARLRPSAVALLAPGFQAISHAQLLAIVQGAQQWLASRGIAPAARIAVLMPAGMELAICCVAIACGTVCIPLHTGLTEPELLALLSDASADVVVGLPGDPLPVRLAQKLGLATLAFDMQQSLEGPSRGPPDVDAPWPEAGDTAFVLFTSGTTGKPKRVPLSQRQIVRSAHHIAQHLELRPEDRALCVMPAYHSHGLIGGLLTPLAAGSSVVCPPVFDAAEFLRWVRDFRPTWYTASPTIHHAVVEQLTRDRAAVPAHSFRLIRSASSALPAELLRRMEEVWGVPVIQSYGMTETATQLASNPLPPGVRKADSVGRPVGAELRVIDDEGHALTAGQTGAVIARGPAVFAGYEDAPETNAEAFLDGWFLTGDLGWFDEDGYLFLTGRSKELINRGGEKISPFEVEQALLRLPGVARAVAYPVDHPTLGEDVHAAVVPAPDSAVAGQVLRSRLFGAIADFKVPACIHVIDQIPAGPGGKVQRRSLHHQIAGLVAPAPAAAPLTPLEARIARMFAQTLGRPMAAVDANFLALGGDSLSAVRLTHSVNETWGLDLSASAVLAAPTVTAFAAAVQAAIDEADALSSALEADLNALSDTEVSRLLGQDPKGR
jgi:acyl-CoA synthetase (AMP-forming)/AMP-acid ligase II